jgi:hypothetical protein
MASHDCAAIKGYARAKSVPCNGRTHTFRHGLSKWRNKFRYTEILRQLDLPDKSAISRFAAVVSAIIPVLRWLFCIDRANSRLCCGAKFAGDHFA